jgi:hypothetical protein
MAAPHGNSAKLLSYFTEPLIEVECCGFSESLSENWSRVR